MIKLFRHVRKKILTENLLERTRSIRAGKFSKPSSPAGKYLLYAIGEIILVVIGILIALQLNNYSEYKKEREKEIALLVNLSNEIGLDVQQIDNNTKLTKERLSRLDSTLKLLQHTESIDKSKFIQQSFEYVIDQYFKSNSGIFDEAVSSGKMSYVQNETLRQNVFDYYRNARQDDNDTTARLVTDEHITPVFVETMFLNPEGFSTLGLDIQNISSLKSVDLEVLKTNKDFWKMVILKFASNREQIMRWERIKVLAQDVKQQIEEELELLDR